MDNKINEIITLLKTYHDDILKEWHPSSCCGKVTMKHIFKSPEAKKISDLLKDININDHRT